MSTTTSPCPGDSDPAFPGVFYVFVHGLIAMHRSGEYIDLLIPNVGPTHGYLYGEFLGEVILPPSAAPYHIVGICGRPPGVVGTVFSPTDHLIVKQAKTLNAEANIYARIRLPLPKAVHSYLKVKLDGVIQDPNEELGSSVGTLTPVLEYSFQDPRDILFGGEPLNVAPLRHRGSWYINLHIFAEEDVEREEDHTIAGFDKLAALFDFAAPPSLVSVSNVPRPEIGDLPCGTTPLEFLTLAVRTRELGYLGRLVRREALENRPLIVHVSSVDGDIVTCLPLVNE
jgi:hypothetical protein